jgi:hypothetical protein
MSKLKLEVGKSYRSRQGDVVKIVGYVPRSARWPFLGDSGHSFTEGGAWFDGQLGVGLDLIEEVATEQDKEQDKEFPIEPNYTLPSYNPNVEAVWSAYVGTIPSAYPTPTLDTLIAARKQLVEAFPNG